MSNADVVRAALEAYIIQDRETAPDSRVTVPRSPVQVDAQTRVARPRPRQVLR
jgi:hypothetical protein